MAVLMLMAGIFLLSFWLTFLTRRYAMRKGLVDIPNHRSSHILPTVRGGGLAIAVAYFTGISILTVTDLLSWSVAFALLGGGSLVAVTGWIDDHRHVPAAWRLLSQFAASLWALYWLGGLPQFDLGAVQLAWGWPGQLLTLIGMIWLTNLYNFMDGSDGLAATQAICAALGGGLLCLAGGEAGLAFACFALAAASAGFLVWNWPPARIFMGDVGSGLLGFSFAVLAVASEKSGAVPVLGWLLLLGVFVFDASYTVLRRLLQSEQVLQAHSSHAYQRLIQSGRSHRRVVILLLLVNMLILWPTVWLTNYNPVLLPGALAVTGLAAWLVWRGIQRNHDRAQSVM